MAQVQGGNEDADFRLSSDAESPQSEAMAVENSLAVRSASQQIFRGPILTNSDWPETGLSLYRLEETSDKTEVQGNTNAHDKTLAKEEKKSINKRRRIFVSIILIFLVAGAIAIAVLLTNNTKHTVPAQRVKLVGEVVILEDWSDELFNRTSDFYITKKTHIEKEIKAALKSGKTAVYFESIEVVNLRRGSIIADIVIWVNVDADGVNNNGSRVVVSVDDSDTKVEVTRLIEDSIKGMTSLKLDTDKLTVKVAVTLRNTTPTSPTTSILATKTTGQITTQNLTVTTNRLTTTLRKTTVDITVDPPTTSSVSPPQRLTTTTKLAVTLRNTTSTSPKTSTLATTTGRSTKQNPAVSTNRLTAALRKTTADITISPPTTVSVSSPQRVSTTTDTQDMSPPSTTSKRPTTTLRTSKTTAAPKPNTIMPTTTPSVTADKHLCQQRCQNGGTCQLVIGTSNYRCVCTSGYTGMYCQYSVHRTLRPWTTRIPRLACRSNSFQCINSACVPHYWVCDGQFDCADGSDESPYLCNQHLISPTLVPGQTTVRPPRSTTTGPWWQTSTTTKWPTQITRPPWWWTTTRSRQKSTTHPKPTQTTRPPWWWTTTRSWQKSTTHPRPTQTTRPPWWWTTTRSWQNSTTLPWWVLTTRSHRGTTTRSWQTSTTLPWWVRTTQPPLRTTNYHNCPSGMFHCGGIQCIRSILRCDGHFQCHDGSDEHGCVISSSIDTQAFIEGQMRPLCSNGDRENADMAFAICSYLGFKRVSSINVNSGMSVQQGVVFLSSNSSIGYLQNLRGFIRSDCSPLHVDCSEEVAQCGRAMIPIHTNFIQYGRQALHGQWPWQARITKGGSPVCGGTLINKYWLLTAAHCVGGSSVSSFRVILGSHTRYRTDPGQRQISVRRIFIPTIYIAESARTPPSNDIALFQLSSPASYSDYIQPACRPQHELNERSVCYITGWGRTESDSTSTTLQQIKVSTYSGHRCDSLWDRHNIIDNMICATRTNGRFSPTCYGDSGGPLVCLNTAGRWEVHGVVSFGPPGCSENTTSLYTTAFGVLTSVYHMRKWIDDTTVCQFTCDDATCLFDKEFICDGFPNCRDGSDEIRFCAESPTCTFEYGNMCGYSIINATSSPSWERVTITNIDQLLQGVKPMDHTTNAFGGYYMNLLGHRGPPAILRSPAITTEGRSMCLQFYFYIYTNMSAYVSLRVMSRDRDGNDRLHWSVYASFGKEWNFVSVTLPSDAVSFLFVGTGSVSLDDVVLASGSCPPISCIQKDDRCDNLCLDSDLLCDGLRQCHNDSNPNPKDEDPALCGANVNCTFSYKYLCGYRNDPSKNISWAHHHYYDHTAKLHQTHLLDRGPGTAPSTWSTPLTTSPTASPAKTSSGTVVRVINIQRHPFLTSVVHSHLAVPQFSTDTASCFEFYYISSNFRDGHVCTNCKLSLMLTNAEGRETELLSRPNDQGQKWRLGQVDLNAGAHSLSFVASISWHIIWHMMLDDTRLISGACRHTVVSCDTDEFQCSPNQCIPKTEFCNGVTNCVNGQDELPGCTPPQVIRLVGGGYPFQGRVEVLHEGRWGSICDKDWHDDESAVVCRMLNLSTDVYRSDFGGGPTAWLYRINCNGAEKSLFDCYNNGWRSGWCSSSNHVSVGCGDPPGIIDYRENNVRLVGDINGWEGRVEIYHNNQWGMICQDGWDYRDAAVVCRMMGYGHEAEILPREDFSVGFVFTKIWLNEVECGGDEARLDECIHSGWDNNSCSHNKDVGVRCLGGPALSLRFNGTSPRDSLRLVGGAVPNEGRVEVLVGDQWGTVCDDNMTHTEADVICNTIGYSGKGSLIPLISPGSGPIYMDEVACVPPSMNFSNCNFRLGKHDCDHYEDVHIRCEEDPFLVSVTDPFPMRLVGGSTYGTGRLEIFKDGLWGRICLFPLNEAKELCTILGFSGYADVNIEHVPSNTLYPYGWRLASCFDGLCIDGERFLCRKYVDYTLMCSNSACPSGMNACPQNSSRGDVICIREYAHCDGNHDCPGSTDEMSCSNCSSSEMTCDGTTCLPLSLRCDGSFHCNDGTDEHRCLYRSKNDQVMVEFGGIVYPVCASPSLNLTSSTGHTLASQICNRLGQGYLTGLDASASEARGVILHSLNWSDPRARALSKGSCGIAQIRCESTSACGRRDIPEPEQHLSPTANPWASRYSLEGEWPWFVRIPPYCTGLMITSEWLLTKCNLTTERAQWNGNLTVEPFGFSAEPRAMPVLHTIALTDPITRLSISLVLVDSHRSDGRPLTLPVCLPDTDNVHSNKPVCYSLGESPPFERLPSFAPSRQLEYRTSLNATCARQGPFNDSLPLINRECLQCEENFYPHHVVCQNALGLWEVVIVRQPAYTCISPWSKVIKKAIGTQCIFSCHVDGESLYDYILLCDGVDHCTDGSDEVEALCGTYLMCTFEYGDCGYSVSKHSQNRWQRIRARGDQSDRYVPMRDHTTNSSRGYVLYAKLDSTSRIRDLNSPDLDVIQVDRCLSFFWRTTIGNIPTSLVVYAEVKGKVVKVATLRAVNYRLNSFRVGSREFEEVFVSLPPLSKRFYLRMTTSVTFASSESLAFVIDDISVTQGICQSTGSVNCSFASAGICGYQIVDNSPLWFTNISLELPANYNISAPAGNLQIRLVNGTQTLNTLSGRVEIYHAGEWGTICDDGFGIPDAEVICRMLGFLEGRSFIRSHFGRGIGRIWLSYLACTGNEVDVTLCSHDDWGSHTCSHLEDAGVECSGRNHMNLETSRYLVFNASFGNAARIFSPAVDVGGCFSFWYQIVGQFGGTLEVYSADVAEDLGGSNGELMWSLSSSSQDSWRSASFPVSSGRRVVFEGRGGFGTNDFIRVDDIMLLSGTCPQSECVENEFRCGSASACIPEVEVCNSVPSCTDLSDEASKICGPFTNCTFESGMCGFTNSSDSQGVWTRRPGLVDVTRIRLADGVQTSTSISGRVEVYHSNQWGTICDDLFGTEEARVICRMLGFPNAEHYGRATFGAGSGQIWLDDMRCIGDEVDLGLCGHGGWGNEDCNHLEDASVRCSGEAMSFVGVLQPDFNTLSTFGAMAILKSPEIVCSERDGSECKAVCVEFTFSTRTDLHSKLTIFGEDGPNQIHRLWTTVMAPHNSSLAVTIPLSLEVKRVHFIAYHSSPAVSPVSINNASFVSCNKQNGSRDNALPLVCNPAMYECKNGACVDKTLTCDGIADCADGSDEWHSHCNGVSLSCTFEEGHTCGYSSTARSSPWKLSNMTNLVERRDWLGPRLDHNFEPGTVLFVDWVICSVSSLVINELLFPSLLWPENGACVQFYYHSRNVFVVSTPRSILLAAPNNNVHNWKFAQFEVRPDQVSLPISILTECSYWHQLAIDDITMTPGLCLPPNTSTENCPDGEWFLCSSGIFEPCYSVCDGRADCADGGDEIGCPCSLHEFRCGGDEGNGKCVQKRKWCDGRSDCPDSYDEQPGCSCLRDYQFACNDGSCMPPRDYCDGDNDCLFGEDEPVNCSSKCDQPFQFSCPSGICLDSTRRCDTRNDCGDLSDEVNCTCHKPFLRCEKSGVCYPPQLLCDGEVFCPDGEDEGQHCFECREDQVSCFSGLCIPEIWRCDGFGHCRDGSDEWNCSNCESRQCAHSGICLRSRQLCDGFLDCNHPLQEDLTDELNCSCRRSQRRCDNGLCRSRDLWCDGVDDCYDNSDEKNCTCSEGQARCQDGECIRDEWLCDGTYDCRDMSDEHACPQCPQGKERACFSKVCLDSGSICDGKFDCDDLTDEEECGVLEIKEGSDTATVYFDKMKIHYPVCADGVTDEVQAEICQYITGGGLVRAERFSDGRVQDVLVYSALEDSKLPLTAKLQISACTSGEILKLACQPSDCGVQPSYRRSLSQIIGGDISEHGRWPWVIALQYLKSPRCGGAIVTEDWIVTAAHCVLSRFGKLSEAYFRVVSGVTNVGTGDDPDAQMRNVTQIFTHPDYDQAWTGDIALLKLDKSLKLGSDFMRPICIPRNATAVWPTSCYVAGWGSTRPGSMDSTRPDQRHARMKLLNTSVCEDAFRERDLTDNVCAGYENAVPGACHGDSGDPLMCVDSAGYWTLLGVVNGGKRFCHSAPNVFASVTHYRTWIDHIIRENS